MQNYLKTPITVPIDLLYPDPNNPRLALDDKPGYTDGDALFDEDMKKRIMEQLGESAYAVSDLVTAIIGQGWMPIDNIIVWDHPDDGTDKHVVLEGNRRRLALEVIRKETLPKERRKLERMQKKSSTYDSVEIDEQKELVDRLERIVADTEQLTVVPIDADTYDELDVKLPRVLAVRHITGAKEWGNYAEDLWLLERFNDLFRRKHGEDTGPFWDDEVIGRVSDEASLSKMKTKWQLKSASWFSHFRSSWEDELPPEEEFQPSDYYLFENIARKPWVREQFSIGEDDRHIPDEMEETLFKWVFATPRGNTADENPNIFYRHENILLWDQIKRYDDKNETSFASRLDPTRPDEAQPMHAIEADWKSHKARRKPHEVLEGLLQQLHDIKADDLAQQGAAFRAQLEQLEQTAQKYLSMIDAAQS